MRILCSDPVDANAAWAIAGRVRQNIKVIKYI